MNRKRLLKKQIKSFHKKCNGGYYIPYTLCTDNDSQKKTYEKVYGQK